MWTKDLMKFLLANSDLAVERALLQLYERQTADEQQTSDTKHQNDRGFTQADAFRFTQLAKILKTGAHLTQKELTWLRSGKSTRFPSRIGKYAGQLAEMLNEQIKECDAQIAAWETKARVSETSTEFADSFQHDLRAKSAAQSARMEAAGWEQKKAKLLPGQKLLAKSQQKDAA